MAEKIVIKKGDEVLVSVFNTGLWVVGIFSHEDAGGFHIEDDNITYDKCKLT